MIMAEKMGRDGIRALGCGKVFLPVQQGNCA
jgi:hypothetical protein